jgi:hypothetical protein
MHGFRPREHLLQFVADDCLPSQQKFPYMLACRTCSWVCCTHVPVLVPCMITSFACSESVLESLHVSIGLRSLLLCLHAATRHLVVRLPLEFHARSHSAHVYLTYATTLIFSCPSTLLPADVMFHAELVGHFQHGTHAPCFLHILQDVKKQQWQRSIST